MDCDAGEIAFIKNTSEGLNIAANAIDWRALATTSSFRRTSTPTMFFHGSICSVEGVEVRMVPEKGDWVDAELLAPFVDERTRVVAVADVAFHPGAAE